MKTKIISVLVFVAFAALPFEAVAGSLTVPNTFVDGTPAFAADVNANFTAVKTEVDDNAVTVASKQNRVTGTCSTGAVTAVNSDGTVVCSSNIVRHISINPYGVMIAGSATFTYGYSDDGAIIFPNIDDPRLDLGFVVPDNYIDGTPVTIEFYWHVKSSSTIDGGTVNLRHNWSVLNRVGATTASFSLPVSSSQVPTAVSTTHLTNFTNSGSTLIAGDAITFGIFRRYGASTDSSAVDIVISGIRVTYEAEQ